MKPFLICFLFFSTAAVIAQDKWELKKNQDGIQVYTRNVPASNIKELRVTCELNATEAQLISTLQDINNYNSWVYSNKKSVILKTINPESIVYYTQSHLPWPIKDRDLVVQLNIDQTPEILNVQAKSLPAYIPRNSSYIRVPYSLAVWHVTRAPDKKLKVDYTFSVDPGGSIPSWLVNATLTVGPFNSFVKLKELLQKKNAK